MSVFIDVHRAPNSSSSSCVAYWLSSQASDMRTQFKTRANNPYSETRMERRADSECNPLNSPWACRISFAKGRMMERFHGAAKHLSLEQMWPWVKKRYPTWSHDKWKQELKPAVVWCGSILTHTHVLFSPREENGQWRPSLATAWPKASVNPPQVLWSQGRQAHPGRGGAADTSSCLRTCFLLVLKGIYHYWMFFSFFVYLLVLKGIYHSWTHFFIFSQGTPMQMQG